MAQKPLHELSLEELNRQRSLYKGILISYAIIGTLMVGLNIYLFITKGQATTIVIPLALLPVVLMVVSSLKKTEAELKQRNEQL